MKKLSGYGRVNGKSERITGSIGQPVKEDTDFFYCLVTLNPILNGSKKIYSSTASDAESLANIFIETLLQEACYIADCDLDS